MKKHILIIDDDQDLLDILKAHLTESGYEVTVFQEVNDIITSVDMYKPDIVILDYLLQGINGGDLCCQIRRNQGTSHIPVILMSAHFRVLLSLGTYDCHEFIEKPFDLNHLSERIDHYLKNGKARPRHKNYIKVAHP